MCGFQLKPNTSTLPTKSRYIHWQGRGRERLQSAHWSEHRRRYWQAGLVMTSRSRLRASDLTRCENWILTEDRTPQPSHARVTASGGLATPSQSTTKVNK